MNWKNFFKTSDKETELNRIISTLNQELEKTKELLNEANSEIYDDQIIINSYKYKSPKEKELNDKYPKVNLTYKRTETDGEYNIDLRNFFQIEDNSIPIVTGKTDDEKALNGLKWVIKNIKYVSDSSDTTYKNNEYWAYPYQTLKHLKGDCEDGAILLANILIRSGVPYWKIRLSAGNVWDGKGDKPKDLNMSSAFTNEWKELKDFKKEIENGITKEQLKQGLKKVKEKVNRQNLRKAIYLAIKEQEQVDNLFVNMLGKELKIEKEFVQNVEQMMDLEYTIKIKIDKTILQKIFKYYVILVILDFIQKKEIVDNLLKDKNLGIKSTEGTAGHCYLTYYCESKDKWVILDWCFWSNQLKIEDRKDYRDEANYLETWFSWNQKYCYSKGLNTQAKELLK